MDTSNKLASKPAKFVAWIARIQNLNFNLPTGDPKLASPGPARGAKPWVLKYPHFRMAAASADQSRLEAGHGCGKHGYYHRDTDCIVPAPP
jgi:hypothetical protein